MGRRKIEIQPITHERNRSVTFLKRKNGLFKKAYELGVLCSVDVAVIIFEERAGHHLKLYQYCSGDIHDIIQRHVRYDGEKDTRTPHDFANNANAKLNNDADVDDDDVDDDDDPDSAPTRGNRKRHEPKLKAEYSNNSKLLIPSAGDMGLNVDMADYHRPMTIPPPPMPLHHSSQLPSAGGGSSLPISTERHTSSGRLLPPNGQLSSQKKPRLAPSVHAGNGSKLSGDESMYNGYLPSPTSAHPSAYRSNGPSSHQLPYNGYMGVSNNSPSQSFIPSSFDFPSSSSRGSNLPRNNSYSQRSSFSQPQEPQLQGMYHQLMRHNLPHGQHSHSSGLHPQQSPDNLLSTFLDNEEHRQPQSTGSQFAPLDWPTHGTSQQAAPPPPPSQPTQQESGPPGDTSWLDFLSQNAPQSGAQPLHMTLPPAHPNGRDGLSWERDHDAEHYSVERGGGAGASDLSHPNKSPTSGGTLMSPRSSRKRPRADSGSGSGGAADEKRLSPSARAVTVSGQDKMHDAGSGNGIDKQDK
ncbi:hypothetical protein K503DRAFT_722620 [Rhizopogon vinicolor AM-OR11-026]|uniref:MADS-box domain-containing protein n=1 Tax=Rhizopogon vinicolor AM-OR11-026 TaxID=1314800 RepID=A0A1B7MSZ7_9AGAM|nr:hypothetical protein K503DRAFT_722620 [Rhizopogon vinicolor AM-OR11-026]